MKKDKEQGGDKKAASSASEDTPIYLTSNSTLQSPEEHERDQSIDPRKDDSMDVSDTDLEEIKAGRLTGREPHTDNEGE